MSHQKERSEKNCLNCHAEVQGRYCQVCGQENIEPFETVWQLIIHFFNDITHFDGKFFNTLKYLIIRPGFLSREYMLGRRASYLNPVRLYVFTSAIFFLIVFSMSHIDEKSIREDIKGHSLADIEKMDSATFSVFTKEINKGKPMTRDEFSRFIDTSKKKGTFSITNEKFRDKETYDSLLKYGKRKDNWLKQQIVYKQIELDKKYQRDGNKIVLSFFNALIHSFPQMLFISLPLFALALKLLYIRHKKYYYVSHAIFSIHLYVFVFIFMLLLIGLNELEILLSWHWINYVIAAGSLFILFYYYKAMRNFYGQSRGKTLVKYLILAITTFFLLTWLFLIFSFFSLLKI